MKKFVLTGASTFGVKNAGDDAMFTNLVNGLRREFQGCDLSFVCRHPDVKFDKTFGVRSIKNIDHGCKQQSLGRWFYGFNPSDDTAHLRGIKLALEQSDALIIGGNSFMEISPNEFLRGVSSYSVMFAQLAKIFEKPYFLYGLAVHPAIKGELTRQIARFICGNARLVMVREEFTKQSLLKAGVPDSNIYVLSDPAFGLDAFTDKSRGLEVLKAEGIELSCRKTVGIGFRLLYWKWKKDEIERYTSKMAGLCDYAVEELDADLLFIPNCTYNIDIEYEDDRFSARQVKKKMSHPTRAHLVEGDYLLPDILSLFPYLDMHISNRRHSCIFAAIHNVPFMPVISENIWHIRPFLESLRVSSEQAVNIIDDDWQTLAAKMRETWERREIICAGMAQRIPELRKKARQYTKLIAENL